MACKDCFKNCPQNPSDKCVEFVGETNDVFGICQGDSQHILNGKIIDYIVSFIDGTGIKPTIDTSTCAKLKTALGTSPVNVTNLLQTIWTQFCVLDATVQANIPSNPVWDLLCLTGLPTNPTRDQILQATINMVCSLKTILTDIPTTYVALTDLETLVLQILANQDTGSTQQYTKFAPYTAVEYYGPLSNFDNTGKGYAALGWDKIYLMNGLNGTQDKRGRVGVGAVNGIPGGTLDAAVDPANPLQLTNVNYVVGQKFGENFHVLNASENGAHTHSISDPGHQHNVSLFLNDSKGGDQSETLYKTNDGTTPTTVQTQPATTGISINSSGSGVGHETRQPSLATNYIIYIP